MSIFLMRIDSISGQRSRVVSSPETSLGALPKLSKRKDCEKSCGHHFIHRVVLTATKVNNEFHCIEVNIPFCQNIRQLIDCSHEFFETKYNDPNSFSQTTNSNRLCAFL